MSEEATMTEAQKACIEAGTPGEGHKRLEPFIGTFAAAVRHWPTPGAEPFEATGTMVNEWVLGGRYLRQTYESDLGGTEFRGIGFWGYNNAAGRYEGVWMDSMSTAIMGESGQCDGRVWTMTGEGDDPSTGKKVAKRSVIRLQDRDRHSMEMYYTGPDGTEAKAMEIQYTRTG
jgi:hypothetical protein